MWNVVVVVVSKQRHIIRSRHHSPHHIATINYKAPYRLAPPYKWNEASELLDISVGGGFDLRRGLRSQYRCTPQVQKPIVRRERGPSFQSW